jgi:iron complex outermembrane receptor protein
VGNKEPDRNDFVESTPDSRPKPETLYDTEVGYRHNSSKINFAGNLFYMDYKNQLVLTGKINDVGEYTRTNIDESYRAGVELDGSWQITQKIKFMANAAYSINKIKNFDEYLDDYSNGGQIINNYKNTDIAFSPSVVSSAELSYTVYKNLVLVFSEKYVGKQYLDNTMNTDRMIKEYYTSDLGLHFVFKTKYIREIGINAVVNNLFNKMYESNGWTYSYVYENEVVTENAYYPQAGINFLVGLSLKF